MKMTDEVIAALKTLRDAADSDFERHRIDVLERDLTNPPAAEQIDDKHQRFNGLTFLKQKNGHYQCSLGIHVAVGLYCYGEIPKGFVVHHIDENPANNSVDNLQILERADHSRIHPPTPSVEKEFTCAYCGKSYIATDAHTNRFCSHSCKCKFHHFNTRKIPVRCVVCGREFWTDKYKPAQCCSPSCSSTLRWRREKGLDNATNSSYK